MEIVVVAFVAAFALTIAAYGIAEVLCTFVLGPED